MASKNKTQIKRDFDKFAAGVAKLEALRQELNALDTKGFDSDVKIIKGKLKNISAIPQITRGINDLKRKIEERNKRRLRAAVHRGVSSRALKESQKVKRNISSLEKLIAQKRKVSVRKQLSKNEVKFVRDMPRLERKLNELKQAFDKHTRSAKVKIDSGVGVLVDTKFDDFIAEIKADLTEKLKEKRLVMDKSLKHDLALRKKIFFDRYRNLVKEYHDKYRERVHNELRREVRNKFNAELVKRLNAEKKKVVNSLIRGNVKRLASERKRMINNLHSRYVSKENKLGRKYDQKIRKLNLKATALNAKLNLKATALNAKLNLKATALNVKGKKLKMNKIQEKEKEKKLVKKEKGWLDKINKMEAREKKVIYNVKSDLKRKLASYKQSNNSKFAKQVEAIKSKMHDELISKTNSLEKEHKKRISQELNQREQQLRRKLEKIYNTRLRNEIMRKNAEMTRKKAELEKHITEQARKLLG